MRSLISWSPVWDLFDIRREMDGIFNNALGKYSEGFDQAGLWAPSVDMTEDPDNIYVRAEVPGMNRDDIKLEIKGDVLILSGEKKHEYEENKENVHRIERSYGSFQRVLRLPAEIKLEDIAADYGDGVLTITLPKTEIAKPKQIDITVK